MVSQNPIFQNCTVFQLFDHCLAPDTMGDGTGCDNMTAVIAKLKSGAFTTKSVTSTQSEANSEAVKRPNEDSTESCPVAKKAKTEINDSTVETTITASDEVKKEEGTTKSD